MARARRAAADAASASEPSPAGAELPFERAVDRLEEIVGRLEGDALELDEALSLFEEGVRLLRGARGVLDRAETRLEQLLERPEGPRLEPWDP